MEKSYTFDLYFRASEKHGDSVIKTEVHDGHHWLNGREKQAAYDGDDPTLVGSMFHLTTNLLDAYGMHEGGIEKLLSGKQCFLDGTTPPIDKLERIGWNIKPYPHKFITVEDADAVRNNAATFGLSLDVSNIVAQEWFVDTRGLVIKGAVDVLDTLKIKSFLYVDYKLWGKLLQFGWNDVYAYLSAFYDVERENRRIVTSPKGLTADDIMLDWADRLKNHVLSRDEFDEYDMRYDWIMHGAENGNPRLHKFTRRGDLLCIPDLGIETEIPTMW